MINCEKFESQYRQWKNKELPSTTDNEMRDHSIQCAHCSSLTDETINLREVVSALPKREPSLRFDYQLRRKINELSNNSEPKRKVSLLPRWAALGAGLATGLAVGIAVLLPLRQEGVDPMGGSGDLAVITAQQTTPDTSVSNADTTLDHESHFHIDDHSQTVSTDR